tara:strand:+ start:3961 stop:4176 length:216 start_codon:yes stop_codon:yes gene_type:complete
MTTNTPTRSFDVSAFDLTRLDTQEIRRAAELSRSDYLGAALRRIVRRITATYRSASGLLAYTQRMNQAARL